MSRRIAYEREEEEEEEEEEDYRVEEQEEGEEEYMVEEAQDDEEDDSFGSRRPFFRKHKKASTFPPFEAEWREKWKRPDYVAPSHNDPLSMVLIQTRVQMEACQDSLLARDTSRPSVHPSVQMFGVTEQGNSVLMRVEGFVPYFWIRAWSDFHPSHLPGFATALDQALREETQRRPLSKKYSLVGPHVLNVSVYVRESVMELMEYVPFLKIELADPALVSKARAILKQSQGFVFSLPAQPVDTSLFQPTTCLQNRSSSAASFGNSKTQEEKEKAYGATYLAKVTRWHAVSSKTCLASWKDSQWTHLRLSEHSSKRVFISKTFESTLDFAHRCMASRKIIPGGWVEATRYVRVPEAERISTCQEEIRVLASHVEGWKVEGKGMRIPPLRILSFDIECAALEPRFPIPEKDPVIQISIVLQSYEAGGFQTVSEHVLTWESCAPLPGGVHVFSHETERHLLLRAAECIRLMDPDLITGYNINIFDYPFLLDRAKQLGIVHSFANHSRLLRQPVFIQRAKFTSRASGTRENVWVRIAGREAMDIITILRREYKLRSYTLNATSQHFLDMKKDDVHHSQITPLHQSGPEGRARLARYCLKDGQLPLLLCHKQQLFVNYLGMARVTGTALVWLWERGQQIKIINQLIRFLLEDEFFLLPDKDAMPESVHNYEPSSSLRGNSSSSDGKNASSFFASKPKGKKRKSTFDSDSDDSDDSDDDDEHKGGSSSSSAGYKGATVLKPECGFYDRPVATVDFASLYPSIMIAYNMCYTTHVPPEKEHLFAKEDMHRSPLGHCFLKKHVREGILPQMLNNLLGERKKTRALMAKTQDEQLKSVLDGLQLAFKICANSIYGFTGATIGQLPLLAIGASVTSYGREMIETTKRMIEEYYGPAHGFAHQAKAIYGDTDSVMVLFGVSDVKTSMDLGLDAATRVSKAFPPPIKLEFEKVYFPYLLMNKKRYAGMYWTKPDKPDKLDTKGLETVRRDTFPFQTKLLKKCLEVILDVNNRSLQVGIDFVKREIVRLLSGNVDLSELIITQQLSKGRTFEAYGNKMAHVAVAMKMYQRDPTNAPRTGDRVPYVMVRSSKGAKAYEKAEDPLYVLEHDLPIDTEYYITKKLTKPLRRIFAHVLGEDWKQMLIGDHTRISRQTILGEGHKGSIKQFATVRRHKCLSCKAVLPLDDATTPLCGSCRSSLSLVYIQQMEQVQTFESDHRGFWSECQRCQGSLTKEVLCANNECSIFYRRMTTHRKLQHAYATLQRFDW